jgi:hypothetical protein
MNRGTEIVSAIKAPKATNIFSDALRKRIKAVINQPFGNATQDPSLRLIKDVLTGHKSYVHLGYHTGKGDDYESVAAIVKNPNLPIECNGAVPGHFGVGVTPQSTDVDDVTKSIFKYGGHFYTMNLEPGLLTQAEKVRGKGEAYVQLDYVIIDPGTSQPGGPLVRIPTITIIEFKTGPDLRFMNHSEEEQMLKGGIIFNRLAQKMRNQLPGGNRSGDYFRMKYYYSPYLSTNATLWKPTWSSKEISYLTISGLSKIIGVSVADISKFGNLRSNFINFFDRKVSEIYDKVSDETHEEEAEFISNYIARILPQSSKNFGVNWTSKRLGDLSKNSNWKKEQQILTRLMARRQLLQNEYNKNKNGNVFKNLVKVTKAILNANKSGVLHNNVKNTFSSFLNRLDEAHKKYMTEEYTDDVFDNWLEARYNILKGRDYKMPTNLTRDTNVLMVRNVNYDELSQLANNVARAQVAGNLGRASNKLRVLRERLARINNLNSSKENKIKTANAIKKVINAQYALFGERGAKITIFNTQPVEGKRVRKPSAPK